MEAEGKKGKEERNENRRGGVVWTSVSHLKWENMPTMKNN